MTGKYEARIRVMRLHPRDTGYKQFICGVWVGIPEDYLPGQGPDPALILEGIVEDFGREGALIITIEDGTAIAVPFQLLLAQCMIIVDVREAQP